MLQSKPVLIVLAVGVFFFAWGVVSFLNKMDDTRLKREMAEKKVAELKIQKEKLATDIAKLKTEDGVEESIRDKFGLAKEGEQVVVIIDDKSQQKKEGESSGGFWGFFKNIFK